MVSYVASSAESCPSSVVRRRDRPKRRRIIRCRWRTSKFIASCKQYSAKVPCVPTSESDKTKCANMLRRSSTLPSPYLRLRTTALPRSGGKPFVPRHATSVYPSAESSEFFWIFNDVKTSTEPETRDGPIDSWNARSSQRVRRWMIDIVPRSESGVGLAHRESPEKFGPPGEVGSRGLQTWPPGVGTEGAEKLSPDCGGNSPTTNSQETFSPFLGVTRCDDLSLPKFSTKYANKNHRAKMFIFTPSHLEINPETRADRFLFPKFVLV